MRFMKKIIKKNIYIYFLSFMIKMNIKCFSDSSHDIKLIRNVTKFDNYVHYILLQSFSK